MNRARAAGLMLMLITVTGCPHAFGKGGTLDRAALKDIAEQLRKTGCDEEDALEECGPENAQLCLDECRKLGK